MARAIRRRSRGSPTSSAPRSRSSTSRSCASCSSSGCKRAEGAPRRRQPLDRHRRHVAVRHRRQAPDAACASAGAAARSAMEVADERRFREYRRDVVLDVRQIDVALRGLRQLGREGAVEELDLDETDRQDLQERGRDRGRVPAAAPQPRQGRAADGRRRLDGSARRAGQPAVHRGVARRPVREVPQLLLPQLRLRRGLRGRAVPQARCRSPTCSRTAIATRSS